jgi:cytochrome P450
MQFDAETLLNPFSLFRQLRESSPLFFVEPLQAWMLLRYDDVKRVYWDHESFSSRNPLRLPSDSPLSIETLVFSDPPGHTRLRALAQAPFTPRRVALLEGRIRELVLEELAAIEGDRFEFVQRFSRPFPAMVIAELLGVDSSDRAAFQRMADEAVRYGVAGEAEAIAATRSLGAFMSSVIAEKRRRPDDKLISAWLAGEGMQEPATEAEIISFGALLLIAGHETTTNLLNNTVRCLSDSPEGRALASSPETLPLVLDEVLRMRGSVLAAPRRTTRDVSIAGQTLPADSLVLGNILAANRDPAAFESPEEFIPRRAPKAILSFGSGIHRCLGEPLAKLECKVALPLLYQRFPSLRVAADRAPEPVFSPFVHGVRSLWVEG